MRCENDLFFEYIFEITIAKLKLDVILLSKCAIDLINAIVIGQVAAGLPAIKIPPFHTKIDGKTFYFTDMIQHLGTTIIALPLISILESIAVAKAFCKHISIQREPCAYSFYHH